MRVAVVDDHQVVREGLVSVLVQAEDIDVVGSFSKGQDLIDALPALGAELVVMDMRLPDGLGSSWAEEIKRTSPDVKVIILTGFHSDAKLILALEAGADGFMYKESSGEDLMHAIREVAAGNFYISPDAARKLRDLRMQGSGESVTTREAEVLIALQNGLTTDEIARELRLSASTVKTHLSSIFRKLGARNRIEALREAVKRGILGEV